MSVAAPRRYSDQEHLTIAEIARRLGRTEATVKAHLYGPTGEKARAVGPRYLGVCRGCGAYMQPRNGEGGAYAYAYAYYKRCHAEAIEQRWTPERVLEAMPRLAPALPEAAVLLRLVTDARSLAGGRPRHDCSRFVTPGEEFTAGLALPPLGVAGLVREEEGLSWPNRRRCAAADDPLSWWRARHPVAGTKSRRMSEFAPTLRVDEIAGRVRLSLGCFFSAEGLTLQEAADELVWKMLVTLMAFRSRGVSGLGVVCRPDLGLVSFLSELDGIAAAGGDIRERLFGPSGMAT